MHHDGACGTVGCVIQCGKEDVSEVGNEVAAIVAVSLGADGRRAAVEEREERVNQNGADRVDGDVKYKDRKVPDVLYMGIFS